VVALSVAMFDWIWVDLPCLRFVSASCGLGRCTSAGWKGGGGDLRALPGGAVRAGRV